MAEPKQRIRLLVLASMALSFVGCTYSGALDPNFHKPSHRDGLQGPKFPLSIAVVKTPELEKAAFAASAGGHGVDIPLGDSIARAVQTELADIFETSGIVGPEAAETYDLLVYPDVEWIETYRHSGTGELRYTVKFRADVVGSRDRLTVTKFASVRKVAYAPPGEAVGAQVLTGASLFLLAPVTVPVTTQAVGAKAKDLIGRTLTDFVHEFGDMLADSGRVEDYVALVHRDQGNDAAALQTTAPQTVSASPYKTAKSKYDPLLDGVVTIRTAEATGSGFFVSADGLIVTNRHVVGTEKTVTIKTRDGGVALGRVLARNAAKDLALLRVSGVRHSHLMLSDGSHAGVGNEVIAIGTPRGFDWSVSRGIISAVRTEKSIRIIQTDAAVNSGNSGGPLIDLASGLVVGVNTVGVRKDLAEGLNFAVSSEDVLMTFADYLKR